MTIVDRLYDTNYYSTWKQVNKVIPNEEGLHKSTLWKHSLSERQTARHKGNGNEQVKCLNDIRI